MRHERKAAWRLESLGFEEVYRYTAGKADWMAAGLPLEGERAGIPRVGGVARRDVPTCELGERVSDFLERAQGSGWPLAVVVNEVRVVLGLLDLERIDRGASVMLVQDVMVEGPVTYRPSVPAVEAAGRLRERGVSYVLVTTSDGELVGVFFAQDVRG
ncbi:CBS domain containing protein [Thermobaculum terrenum ATCC BAA-798]|uniref:CBS domain containing protein n=1 Tax=Thermobaculum terrenum (strain ATCC BAA-798 / CCMEE 7001 / YNP1) TaxID=525904 RepID=D1CGW6_THET1|nr:CBS domain-containing protein [Thermobaculum terrenum]ACZ42987.1 CBS domain containing protein [Thermobaculum terrenum ATCC BAA-798]